MRAVKLIKEGQEVVCPILIEYTCSSSLNRYIYYMMDDEVCIARIDRGKLYPVVESEWTLLKQVYDHYINDGDHSDITHICEGEKCM